MTVEELLKYLEEQVAPVSLSDEFCARYKAYDNSGVIVNCGNAVNGALFTLDLSEASVAEAERLGFDTVVTHHPAIYGGISRFDLVSDPQARALSECMKKGISVLSMHLNFDAAPQGIDYYLMRGVGGEREKILADLVGGGYGRFYAIAPIALGRLAEKIGKTFSTDKALVYGDANRLVSSVASFCGAGCDDAAIAFAKAQKADLFLSSDMKHHQIAGLVESGLCVIQLTHYCAESYGFRRIYDRIKENLSMPTAYYCDRRLM